MTFCTLSESAQKRWLSKKSTNKRNWIYFAININTLSEAFLCNHQPINWHLNTLLLHICSSIFLWSKQEFAFPLNCTIFQHWRALPVFQAVISVTKLRNIVPTVCYRYTTYVLWSHHYTHLHLSMQFLALEVCSDYYIHPPGMVSPLIRTITCLQAMALHIHTHGRFNNDTAPTSVIGETKLGPVSWVRQNWEILCLERESNPWASVFHYIT